MANLACGISFSVGKETADVELDGFEGKMQEAIPLFEKALELSPESTLVLNSLGFAYVEAEQSSKGVALLRHSLELQPDQLELKGFMAR